MWNLTRAAARWVAPPLTGTRLRRVDAVNTFRVSAGRFAYFRVVSRRQLLRFRRSHLIL